MIRTMALRLERTNLAYIAAAKGARADAAAGRIPDAVTAVTNGRSPRRPINLKQI
jgi:hypothetical protein